MLTLTYSELRQQVCGWKWQVNVSFMLCGIVSHCIQRTQQKWNHSTGLLTVLQGVLAINHHSKELILFQW